MVYAKLAYLAFIAFICQVSDADAQNLRRVRPGCAVPQAVPRPPAPCRPNVNLGALYRYEHNLEEIISKLVNALIYTVVRKDGSVAGGSNGGAVGGNGGGAGGGGAGGGIGNGDGAGNGGSESTDFLRSLLGLHVDLDGMELLDLAVLPENSGNGSSTSRTQNSELTSLVRQLLRLILG